MPSTPPSDTFRHKRSEAPWRGLPITNTCAALRAGVTVRVRLVGVDQLTLGTREFSPPIAVMLPLELAKIKSLEEETAGELKTACLWLMRGKFSPLVRPRGSTGQTTLSSIV